MNEDVNDSRYREQPERRRRNNSDQIRALLAWRRRLQVAIRVVQAAGPWGWIITGIILAIIIILFLFFKPSGNPSSQSEDGQPTIGTPGGPTLPPILGLNLTLEGPESSDNGQTIEYTITYTYNPPPDSDIELADIVIYKNIPQDTELVSASGEYTTSSGIISWDLSKSANQTTLTVTLRPTRNDIFVIGKAYARAFGAAQSIENISPNNDNCGGEYTLSTQLGNFGDPNCDFTKDGLYSLLQGVDSANADFWYFTIVPCESSYNPNAHNPNAVDADGGWGLFQMGRGRNGEYDHGDVSWQRQASNAVNYNSLIGNSFAYWHCAG